MDSYVQTFSLCVTCEPAAERHRDRICANNCFLHETETSVCKIRYDASSYRWRRRQWRTLKCRVVLFDLHWGAVTADDHRRAAELLPWKLIVYISFQAIYVFFVKQPWSNFFHLFALNHLLSCWLSLWPVKKQFLLRINRNQRDRRIDVCAVVKRH